MNNRGTSYMTWVLAGVIICVLFFSAYLFYDNYQNYPSPLDQTLVKTFSYDTDDPIVALAVNLTDPADLVLAQGVTNSTGQVEFAGLANGDYNLVWLWGGSPFSEPVTIDSTKILWELENVLVSKSGRGIWCGGNGMEEIRYE